MQARVTYEQGALAKPKAGEKRQARFGLPLATTIIEYQRLAVLDSLPRFLKPFDDHFLVLSPWFFRLGIVGDETKKW